jgi:hypothetical protein
MVVKKKRKEEIEAEQQEKEKKRKIQEQMDRFKAFEEKMACIFLLKIYENLRFYIRYDGTMRVWLQNYTNEYIRIHRNAELVKHSGVVFRELN